MLLVLPKDFSEIVFNNMGEITRKKKQERTKWGDGYDYVMITDCYDRD